MSPGKFTFKFQLDVVGYILKSAKDLATWFLELLRWVAVVAAVGAIAKVSDNEWLPAVYSAAVLALFVWALHPTLVAVENVRSGITTKTWKGWLLVIVVGVVAWGVAALIFTIATNVLNDLIAANPLNL